METPVDPFLDAGSLVGSSLKEGLARFFGFNHFKGDQEIIWNPHLILEEMSLILNGA